MSQFNILQNLSMFSYLMDFVLLVTILLKFVYDIGEKLLSSLKSQYFDLPFSFNISSTLSSIMEAPPYKYFIQELLKK